MTSVSFYQEILSSFDDVDGVCAKYRFQKFHSELTGGIEIGDDRNRVGQIFDKLLTELFHVIPLISVDQSCDFVLSLHKQVNELPILYEGVDDFSDPSTKGETRYYIQSEAEIEKIIRDTASIAEHFIN